MNGTGPLSPRNPRVTAARRLLRGRGREQQRLFLAEGPQAVREALLSGAARELFVDVGGRGPVAELLDLASAASVAVHAVAGETLAALTDTVTPQGVVAVCRFVDVSLDDALGGPAGRGGGAPTLVVVLVQARDPGNAGTVIRTADAAGADAVVLTEASVDPYNGKCVRASAGSLFHLPVVTGVPVVEAVTRVRSAGMQVLAADGDGALDLDDAADDGTLSRPTAWLFGNEAWGLSAQVRALADAAVRVPIHGAAESLNLATAAAVCLYGSARAQRSGARVLP